MSHANISSAWSPPERGAHVADAGGGHQGMDLIMRADMRRSARQAVPTAPTSATLRSELTRTRLADAKRSRDPQPFDLIGSVLLKCLR